MDHPNIAKVLDGGATEAGRPFFVMELVQGIPIPDFCDRNKLKSRQRLQLFVAVCQAVQHAHQKGIATASADRTARLWDSRSGQPLRKPINHGRGVLALEFSPDGTRLLTSTEDGSVRVWDAVTGQPLTLPMRHSGLTWTIHFSADGKRVLSASYDHTVRVWDAETGYPLSELLWHGGAVLRAVFDPNQSRLVTAADDGTFQFWEMPIPPVPAPAWFSDLAEAIGRKRFNAAGELEPVPSGRLHELKEIVLRTKGNDFYSRWARWFFLERSDEPVEPFIP